MATKAGCIPHFFTLPRELRDQVYQFYYHSLERRFDIHLRVFSSSSVEHDEKPDFAACFALVHASHQLRNESLPLFLAGHRIIIHPGPASSLTNFVHYFHAWLPHIRNLCIADSDVFLDSSARREPNGLRQLLASVSKQSGASLQTLRISLPRSDWNNLAGCKVEDILRFWLFEEILEMKGLVSFEFCSPPDRADRPRWGRKPSWDIVAKRMVCLKWKLVESCIVAVVTKPPEELSIQ